MYESAIKLYTIHFCASTFMSNYNNLNSARHCISNIIIIRSYVCSQQLCELHTVLPCNSVVRRARYEKTEEIFSNCPRENLLHKKANDLQCWQFVSYGEKLDNNSNDASMRNTYKQESTKLQKLVQWRHSSEFMFIFCGQKHHFLLNFRWHWSILNV